MLLASWSDSTACDECVIHRGSQVLSLITTSLPCSSDFSSSLVFSPSCSFLNLNPQVSALRDLGSILVSSCASQGCFWGTGQHLQQQPAPSHLASLLPHHGRFMRWAQAAPLCPDCIPLLSCDLSDIGLRAIPVLSRAVFMRINISSFSVFPNSNMISHNSEEFSLGRL